ncbi:MAG: hypothetical protein K2X48_04990 [Chitinophagaceae bacterium]|nr:hypothetical protein [Chitinophagaceae bacterium]
MKRGVFFLLVGASCLFFFVERYLFNGIGLKPLYLAYLVTFSVYFLGSFLLFKFLKGIPPFFIGSVLLTPQIVVLFFVLFTKELHFRIPSVYPSATFIVLAGITLGYFLIREKYITALLSFFLSAILVYLYYFFWVIPSLINNANKRNINESVQPYIFFSLKDKDGASFQTIPINGKILYFEFWFRDCFPCWNKMATIEKLTNTYKNDSQVAIYSVNAGNIDSFEVFKNEVEKEGVYKQLINLYDSAGLFAKQFDIKAYPVDVIIYKNKIVRVFNGWQVDMEKEYLKQTIKILNKLKKE